MKIYLDNNIYIYIEEGKLNISDIQDLVCSKNLKIFYSPAHIQETLEIKGGTIQRSEWINKRLNTIGEISNNNYLNISNNIIFEYLESPYEVMKTITEVPNVQNIIKTFVNYVDEETKVYIRQVLGIDSNKINKLNSRELIEEFDNIFSKIGIGTFLNFLEHSMTFHPQYKTFGISNKIAAIFEVLDMLGYNKDKYNEKSNYARTWDIDHCFYASSCDFLISNDRRMINKSKIVYDLYNIKTKAIIPNLKNIS